MILEKHSKENVTSEDVDDEVCGGGGEDDIVLMQTISFNLKQNRRVSTSTWLKNEIQKNYTNMRPFKTNTFM